MKTISKVLSLGLVLVSFSATISAQSNATAKASAQLLTPLKIERQADMSFGTIASNLVGGNVTLGFDGSLTASGEGVRIMNSSTGQAASFLISGEGSQSISISHPASLVLADGSESLTVESIMNDLTNSNEGSYVLPEGGSAILKIKGILVVPALAKKGNYINEGGLEVTVNYN